MQRNHRVVKILDSAEHVDKWTDCCTVSCGRLILLVTTVKFERQQKVEKCQHLVLLPFTLSLFQSRKSKQEFAIPE